MFFNGWTVKQQYVHTIEHYSGISFKKEKAWDIPHELLVGRPNNASKPLLVLLLVAQQLDCKILLKTRHTLVAGQQRSQDGIDPKFPACRLAFIITEGVLSHWRRNINGFIQQ